MIKTTILKDGKRVTLRKHQKDAVHSAITHYNMESPRATISHCCRSGKSLTAVTLHKSLRSRSSVVFLPSISLVDQTIRDWLPNLHNTKVLIVCSDKSTYEGEVTSDPKEIKKFIENCGDSKFVIFSTYKSSKRICQALQLLNDFSFDFLVADEAHRASGINLKDARFVHYDDCIRATNRLYMTATPKSVSKHLQPQLHESAEVLSMDDSEIFGKDVHSYSFKDGIEDGILSDYKILAIGCKNPTTLDILEDAEKKEHESIIETAKLKALKKALSKHKATHCISFHSSVRKALFFQDNLKLKGWKTFHINSNMNAKERSIEIESFKKAKKAVMTNCRCLQEGVNIKKCDSVFFADTKNGTVDVIQSASRPLTRDESKPKGFKNLIIIPTFHNATDSAERIQNTNAYKTLIQLIKHMGGLDDRIEAFIMAIAKGCYGSVDMNEAIIQFEGFANLQKDLVSKIIPYGFQVHSDQELFQAFLDYGKNAYKASLALGYSGGYIKLRANKSPWLTQKIQDVYNQMLVPTDDMIIEAVHKNKGSLQETSVMLGFKAGSGLNEVIRRKTKNGDFSLREKVDKAVACYQITDDACFNAVVECGGNMAKAGIKLGKSMGFINCRVVAKDKSGNLKCPELRTRILKWKEEQKINPLNGNKLISLDSILQAIKDAKGDLCEASRSLGKSPNYLSGYVARPPAHTASATKKRLASICQAIAKLNKTLPLFYRGNNAKSDIKKPLHEHPQFQNFMA